MGFGVKEQERLREIEQRLEKLRAQLPGIEETHKKISAERLKLIDEITSLQLEKEDICQGQLLL